MPGPEILPPDSAWFWPGQPAGEEYVMLPGRFLTQDTSLLRPADTGLPLKFRPEMDTQGWVFWIFALSLLVVGIVRFSFPRRFQQLSKALASERSLVSMLREGDLFNERIMPGLLLVFAALMGLLFLIHAYQHQLIPGPLSFDALAWGVMTLAVLCWWMLRSLAIWILGFVFKTFEATAMYLSRILAMNLGFGLLLTVTLPLAWYAGLSWMITGLLYLAVAFNVYRILRSLGDGIRLTPFGLSYLLLFAFTLEVLPVLILVGFLRFF